MIAASTRSGSSRRRTSPSRSVSVGGRSRARGARAPGVVGTRAVLGVHLAGREAFPVSLQDDVWGTRAVDRRRSPSRLAGPPYAVAEHVFDECELDAIGLVPEEDVAKWTPDQG